MLARRLASSSADDLDQGSQRSRSTPAGESDRFGHAIEARLSPIPETKSIDLLAEPRSPDLSQCDEQADGGHRAGVAWADLVRASIHSLPSSRSIEPPKTPKPYSMLSEPVFLTRNLIPAPGSATYELGRSCPSPTLKVDRTRASLLRPTLTRFVMR